MAASAEDLAKVGSAVQLVRDGEDVDAFGQQVANAYSIKRIAAFVKDAPLDAFPPTVSPVLAMLLVDLAEAQIWGTTNGAAITNRTAALLPRDGNGAALASGLAVSIWDSWEGIEKERQRARATVASMLNSYLPDAIAAWVAVYPSAALEALSVQLQAITGAQVQADGLNQDVLRAVCSFSTTAARAAEGEMSAIPTFSALAASATRNMNGIGVLAASVRDEIRATRPVNGVPAQGGAAVQAARLAARNRLLTGIGALIDL